MVNKNKAEQMELEDKKALENFVYKNDELEELETYYDKFNLFSALNIVGQEIRHSNFLGWICDPTETHELGDYFLSLLIKEINFAANEMGLTNLSIFEIDGMTFNDVEIRREWRNIDIFILDRPKSRYWLIENKVYSGEHSDQLSRYKAIAEAEFPSYSGTFAFLTVDGIAASSTDYVSITYSLVSELIGKLLIAKNDKISSDILIFVQHYQQLLKQYILKDTRLQEICETIYKNHKRALDLIYEYKPDQSSDIRDILLKLVAEHPDLVEVDSNKAYIRFVPKSFDHIPNAGSGWVSGGQIFAFEFRNTANTLKLHLVIGPGDQVVRQKIYELTSKNPSVFNKSTVKLHDKWSSRHVLNFLSKKELSELEYDDLQATLEKRFLAFLDKPMNSITDAVASLNF